MKFFWVLPIISAIFYSCTSVDRNQQPEYYEIKYLNWRGSSPGDKITHTSLFFAELNLDNNNMMILNEIADDPDPMLPYSDEGINNLIKKAEWERIPDSSLKRIIFLVDRWLETNPPPTYNLGAGLGIEDGARDELSVTGASKKIMTKINYRAGYSPETQSSPPPEWNDLVNELFRLGKLNRKLITN